MIEHRFVLETEPGSSSVSLPTHLLAVGGRYQVQVSDGDVYVAGNREGLLYLAEAIAACALGGFQDGFHMHLPLSAESSDAISDGTEPELILFGASSNRL